MNLRRSCFLLFGRGTDVLVSRSASKSSRVVNPGARYALVELCFWNRLGVKNSNHAMNELLIHGATSILLHRTCYIQSDAVFRPSSMLIKRRSLLLTLVWAFLVVFAVHLLDFPGSVPRFKTESRGGTLLDVAPSFTVDGVYKRLADYGEQGRESYSFRNTTVDIILPLSLLPFFYLLMLKAVKSAALHGILVTLLLAVPFAYVFFDLFENAAVLILLDNYPTRWNSLAAVLPYATSVKRAFSLLAILIPLAILGTGVVRAKFRKSYASD
jgi:hypothetical protein